MVDFIRKQLDELLGADRNELTGKKDNEFTHHSNCRLFLAGMCTYEMFANTKADLGTCNKIHSIPMKASYDKKSKYLDYGYEDILERHLLSLIKDCDRRIESAKRRIEENERAMLESSPYEKDIKALEEKLEVLGEEGNVDEFIKVQEELEKLKERRNMERIIKDFPEDEVGLVLAQHSTQPQHQILRVCEICGSLLSARESKRLEDHYAGKLHMGYKAIREKLEELKNRDRTRPLAKEYEGYDHDYEVKDRSKYRSRGYDKGSRSRRNKKRNYDDYYDDRDTPYRRGSSNRYDRYGGYHDYSKRNRSRSRSPRR